jgi:hypothetical protein
METEKELFTKKFVDFLHYSKIDSARYEFDEEKQKWIVLIDEEQEKQVGKLYQAFYAVESENYLTSLQETTGKKTTVIDGDTAEEENSFEEAAYDYEKDTDFAEDSEEDGMDYDSSDEEVSELNASGAEYKSMFSEDELQNILDNTKPKPIQPKTYIKKEEQYRDLKSSASTFVMVSILGLAIVLLNAAGIIHIFAGPLPYIVMTALLLSFLYIGISSYVKAGKVQTEIAGENNVTEAINNWLSNHLTAEQLDAMTDSNETAEIRFFHKLEKMKELIKSEFGDMDDSYLDLLVEEYYNVHFEDTADSGLSE